MDGLVGTNHGGTIGATGTPTTIALQMVTLHKNRDTRNGESLIA